MGLDNGIIIKGKTFDGQKFVREFFDMCKPDADVEFDGSRELAYWRKCWNIRHSILGLPFAEGYNGEGGDIRIFISDIPSIVEALKYYLNESHWNENGGSIWEWYVALRNIADVIWILIMLAGEIEESGIEDPDIDIFFYDSY